MDSNLLHELETLEPVFVEAANLALFMQGRAAEHQKLTTGDPVVDIVTDADLAAQEHLLRALRGTPLKDCRLLAEEKTESVIAFPQVGSPFLSIDPIDDTAIYARGGQHFSTIVTLHDGERVRYLFIYFPAWKWTIRVVDGMYETRGEAPNISQFVLPQTILYWKGDPKTALKPETLEIINERNLTFQKVQDVSPLMGSIALFALGAVGGIYEQDFNVYDGLSEYTIAKARSQRIFESGPGGSIDLKHPKYQESGQYYEGVYLALT